MQIFIYKIGERNNEERYEIIIGNGEHQDSLSFALMPDVTKGIDLLLKCGFNVLGIRFKKPWDLEIRKVQGKIRVFDCHNLSKTEIEGIKQSVMNKIEKGVEPQY